MKPTSRRPLVGAAVAAVLLTGCDIGGALDAEEPEDDPSVTESSDPADVEDGLAIGETFEGATSTTVESIERGAGAASWLPAGGNFEWLSPIVRTCVSSGGSTAEVGWYQWAATGADGGWYAADLDYDDPQPTDLFPQLADLAPGECAEGRILIAVPRDAEVVTLINADRSGTPQGTWLVGDAGLPAAADG